MGVGGGRGRVARRGGGGAGGVGRAGFRARKLRRKQWAADCVSYSLQYINIGITKTQTN